MTSEVLEDFSIALPAIPAGLFGVIRTGMRNHMGDFSWKVDVGNFVTEGQEIADYYGFGKVEKLSVLAPISGKVTKRGNTDICHWSKETQSPAWGIEPDWKTSFVIIQPHKGLSVQNVVIKAYAQIINFIEDYIYKPNKALTQDQRDEYGKDLKMLKRCEARIVSLRA
jgi:hypothetical protein